MKNKKILILGDSYSTFEGYIPEGYACYYNEEDTDQRDVRKVSETWWHILEEKTDSKIILNNSWSGSTICNTAYCGVDCSQTSSFIHRLDELVDNDFFEKNDIDTVLVFGGTNDNWADSPIGELKYENRQKEDLFSALPAMCDLLHKLKNISSVKNIFVIINTELKDEITQGFVSACDHYGVTYIQLENIDKLNGHPTVKGMSEIAEQIEKKWAITIK